MPETEPPSEASTGLTDRAGPAATYRAMVLEAPGSSLRSSRLSEAPPAPGQIRIRVHACGVCRTDLHIVDGELPDLRCPIVPGHEIVGTVEACGSPDARYRPGDRVGVPWLGWSCGACAYCRGGRENLCDQARFTGFQIDGGFAEKAVVDERFCFALPASYGDVEAAPLLCAGLIGYRALRMAGDARKLGIYGFGAAGHIVAQVAKWQGREVFAFVRPGDEEARHFALELGAAWAGSSEAMPPEPLDAALIFAPVGALVPAALRAVAKGGTVVCAGIHMSEIPAFPYRILWEERSLRSVANLTRADAEEFLALASKVRIRTQTRPYRLAQANEALDDLREGRLRGAAVLTMSEGRR